MPQIHGEGNERLLGYLVPDLGPSRGLIFPPALDIHNSSCVNPAVCYLGGGGRFCYLQNIPLCLTDPNRDRAV